VPGAIIVKQIRDFFYSFRKSSGALRPFPAFRYTPYKRKVFGQKGEEKAAANFFNWLILAGICVNGAVKAFFIRK
jgi:hypothetical protein